MAKKYLVHSCSADRTICTYNLKLEKKENGHQTKNGALFGMTQRKENELDQQFAVRTGPNTHCAIPATT